MLRYKSKFVLIVVSLSFIASLCYNFHLYKYKEIQKISYSQKINYGAEGGLKYIALYAIEDVIKSLQNNSSRELVLRTLESLAASLQMAEQSFRLLDPDFEKFNADTYYISSFLLDVYMYVRADLASEIYSNQTKLDDTEMRNIYIEELQILLDDFKYIAKNFDEEILLSNNPRWIESKWKEMISEITEKNPQFRLYARMIEKYSL